MCEDHVEWDKEFGVMRCVHCVGISTHGMDIKRLRNGTRHRFGCRSLQATTHPQTRLCRPSTKLLGKEPGEAVAIHWKPSEGGDTVGLEYGGRLQLGQTGSSSSSSREAQIYADDATLGCTEDDVTNIAAHQARVRDHDR